MLTFDDFLAVRHGFFDLDVYHGAINYWVHDGGSLYDYLKPFSTYGFTYPPFARAADAAAWRSRRGPSPSSSAASPACGHRRCVIYWLVDPVARREGWIRWYALALAICFAIAFEPLRETFLFGQVNMYLVVLVAADLLLLVSRGSRFAGVRIGLATAIKLTPGRLHRLPAGDQAVAGRARGQRHRGRRDDRRAAARAGRRPGCSGPTRCGTPTGSARWRSSPTSRSTARWPGSTPGDPSTALWLAPWSRDPGGLGRAGPPGGGRRRRDDRLRPHRHRRLPDQPDHLGAPPGLGSARPLLLLLDNALRTPDRKRRRRLLGAHDLLVRRCCAAGSCGRSTRAGATPSAGCSATPTSGSASRC